MGDFQANFVRPDAGIRTVEGSVSGSRAAQMEKRRQRDQEAFEARKQQLIVKDHASEAANYQLDRKFAAPTLSKKQEDAAQQRIGLVTAEEFRRLEKEEAEAKDDAKETAESEADRLAREKAAKKARKKKKKEKKKMLSTLSFATEEDLLEEEEEETSTTQNPARVTSKKDPTVDTSFLPDKARDQATARERERLELEWKIRQKQMQQEELEITYSYWDGTGHRRSVQIRKGDSIGDFLEKIRQDLAKDFRELGSVASDALLYVKEDLILPHDVTFYDLIASKARGKSGPLFMFDVHDDIRVGAIDARVEKEESHPGKVVERRWYERNKHIFPASKYTYSVQV